MRAYVVKVEPPQPSWPVLELTRVLNLRLAAGVELSSAAVVVNSIKL